MDQSQIWENNVDIFNRTVASNCGETVEVENPIRYATKEKPPFRINYNQFTLPKRHVYIGSEWSVIDLKNIHAWALCRLKLSNKDIISHPELIPYMKELLSKDIRNYDELRVLSMFYGLAGHPRGDVKYSFDVREAVTRHIHETYKRLHCDMRNGNTWCGISNHQVITLDRHAQATCEWLDCNRIRYSRSSGRSIAIQYPHPYCQHRQWRPLILKENLAITLEDIFDT